jgi:hypothetical protein
LYLDTLIRRMLREIFGLIGYVAHGTSSGEVALQPTRVV